jgi:hypothetical protein
VRTALRLFRYSNPSFFMEEFIQLEQKRQEKIKVRPLAPR